MEFSCPRKKISCRPPHPKVTRWIGYANVVITSLAVCGSKYVAEEEAFR